MFENIGNIWGSNKPTIDQVHSSCVTGIYKIIDAKIRKFDEFINGFYVSLVQFQKKMTLIHGKKSMTSCEEFCD